MQKTNCSWDRNTIIHNIAEVGQRVKTGDSLLDFTTSFEDPATAEFLADLSRTLVVTLLTLLVMNKSKLNIQVKLLILRYTITSRLTELSDSLVKLIKKYRGKIQKRKSALGDIKTDSVHIPPLEQQKGDKVGQEKYDGVMIEIFMEYEDLMTAGDKLTFNTALKAVIAKVVSIDESPISEYRQDEHVEAILTPPTGVISRMTWWYLFDVIW